MAIALTFRPFLAELQSASPYEQDKCVNELIFCWKNAENRF